MESCANHPHERGSDLCRRCAEAFCTDCLVFAFGASKPPFCMGCAMYAAGVRSVASRPAATRRELRARRKAVARPVPEAVAAAEAQEEELPAAMAPVSSFQSITDWSAPWQSDRQPALTTD